MTMCAGGSFVRGGKERNPSPTVVENQIGKLSQPRDQDKINDEIPVVHGIWKVCGCRQQGQTDE